MLLVGLNPYGLCCTFGFVGQGTERGARQPLGLDDFISLGEEIGVRSQEFDIRMLEGFPSLGVVGQRLRERGTIPIVSVARPTDELQRTIEIAAQIGAKLIRMAMTPVLCGDRASRPNWDSLIADSRRSLEKWAPVAAEYRVDLAIENHQDLTSGELLEFSETAGPNVGIVFDTCNPLAVGESILAFAERVAPRVRHVHLKDYRVQFTDEGYRLVRCAIGDGCTPFSEIAQILGRRHENLTASLEPGALEARHVRVFTDDWWEKYPPRTARELGAAIRQARQNMLPADADYRTPWELDRPGDEIVAFERQQLEQSVENMKTMGWM